MLINKALIEIPPEFAGMPPVSLPQRRKGQPKPAGQAGRRAAPDRCRSAGAGETHVIAGRAIHEAVLQHLQSLVGADVQVTLEIHAYLPEGAPENVVRTVTENARTLRFEGFWV